MRHAWFELLWAVAEGVGVMHVCLFQGVMSNCGGRGETNMKQSHQLVRIRFLSSLHRLVKGM